MNILIYLLLSSHQHANPTWANPTPPLHLIPRTGQTRALCSYMQLNRIQRKVVGLSNLHIFVAVVQLLSHVQLFVAPWTAARQAPLSSTISWSLFTLMPIELMMPSNHLILCCSLLLLPSIFPSFKVFSSESALRIRWPKYWSFSFSISPSNEYSGLISFRIDWFDLLAVQGTLKSLQHNNLKALVLQCSALS